jgi:conjugative transposon TraM protein
MKKELNKKEALRQLRLQLALPGPLVLLVTLMFWAFGGGSEDSKPEANTRQGLNVVVPGPAREGKPVDKLALYKQAQLDSIRAVQKEKGPARLSPFADSTARSSPFRDSTAPAEWSNDPNERRVMQQLADLKARLHASPSIEPSSLIDRQTQRASQNITTRPDWPHSHAPDMDRLERLLTSLKETGSTASPEMQQLDHTLDKLIAVQQPGRVGRLPFNPPAADSTAVPAPLRVTPLGKEEAIAALNSAQPANNRFYDLESSSGEEEPTGSAIEAIVPETQTLVSGAMIRLELATELIIRGQRVRKGTTIYGTVRLDNERLQVNIGSIRSGNDVFPVALRALDQDGIAGIYSPGSATRDAARESAAEAAGGLGPDQLETTTSGQALNAGIQLARNLSRRKVQLTRVTVKAGYRLFLQDESKGH